MFEQYIAGSGWQVLLCMPGESFDRTVCMCVPNSYNGTGMTITLFNSMYLINDIYMIIFHVCYY